MSGSLTIRRAQLVLPDRVVTGDVLVSGGVIEQVGPDLGRTVGDEIDGTGLTVLPGVVDALVAAPLRGDGAALARLSGEAARAGVTSLLLHDPDEPAESAEILERQLEHAARHARVHYGVWAGPGGAALADGTPGAHAAIGRSPAGPIMDPDALDALLEDTPGVVVIEGQDAAAIAERLALYAEAVDPSEHTSIYVPELAAAIVRDVAVIARKHGTRVLLPRVSSRAELDVLAELDVPSVSAQVTLPHLFMKAPAAYQRLGVRAVCDPPVRDTSEVEALWAALAAGVIDAVGSGHVTVPAADKDAAYPGTPGGMPTLSAVLPLLLDRASRGDISLRQVARWTAEAPARILGLPRMGRLEVGYDADLVLVDIDADITLGASASWSGWSPFDGFTLRGRPVMTVLRGRPVFRDDRLLDGSRGRALAFSRP